MGIEELIGEMCESVDEVLESAERIKGKLFATVVATVFDLMQASYTCGTLQQLAAEKGVDIESGVRTLATLAGVAGSRVTSLLTEQGAQEAMALADRLMQRHMDTQARVLRASQGG